MEVIKIKRVVQKNDKGAFQNKDDWTLTLSNIAVLKNSEQVQVERFTVEEAFSKFEFVRFSSGGAPNFTVNTSDGERVHFALWPKTFKKIQAFTLAADQASSSKNLRSLKIKSWGGIVMALIGLGWGAIVGLPLLDVKVLMASFASMLLGLTIFAYYSKLIRRVKKSVKSV